MASDYKQKWKKGLALWDCYQRAYEQSLCALEKRQRTFEAQRGIKNVASAEPFNFEEYRHSPEGMGYSKEASNQARKLIIEQLIRGEAQAFGMKDKDQSSENIAPIDGAVMAQAESGWVDGLEIDYKHGILTHNGTRYTHVRVYDENKTRNEGIIQTPAPLKSGKPIKRPAGRPNVDQKVNEAIKALIKSDESFLDLKRAEQCDRVRNHLFGKDVSHTAPPRGYKDGAIKARLVNLKPS
ncbi:MAG: hypothetical protein Q9M33_13015 [Robiginitomaculum sp.]|nr:hypothetical protein [Robiginitomaculum sp.]